MPELRQNPATRDWVVIATERAKRPEQFTTGKSISQEALIENEETCPFCLGNESKTPPEILSYRPAGTEPNTPGWWLRIIPNMYPALVIDGKAQRRKIEDYFLSMNGIGNHEVLIESPNHSQTIATMEQRQVEEIFLAYRERYISLAKDPNFEMITIFRNHGINAGTSIRHPHSQIIAAPIVPQNIRQVVEEAMRYFDDKGTCVYCDMIASEVKLKERVVSQSENFVVIQPFASRSPFETWVLPKEHGSTYDEISPEACKELAFVMRTTLAKLYKGLNNPDYNYVIVSSPCHERKLEYYHWYIKIVPRISHAAGFELGSGIYINTVVPEEAAKFLSDIKVE
ncbi:MAG: galactose-1-phosphate uridylyltransferase [Candidatus Margulisiibacteriota bacterium]